jgi:Domain of unknown function (DUF1834)
MSATTVLAGIETNAIAALSAALKAAGLGVQEVDLDENPPGISQTAVHCSISDIKFDPVTMVKWKALTTLSVFIFVKNTHSQKERRHETYPIIMGCLGTLCNSQLGLAIHQLSPKRLVPVTPAAWKDSGIIVYQLDFGTSFNVSAADLAAEAADLLSVGIKYYLTPGDDVPDAEDTLITPPPEEDA